MEPMTKNEIGIFNELADEKSKRIFLTRKEWAKTGSADFASVLDGRGVKPIMELQNKLKNKTFVCYGAGQGCYHFLEILSDFGMMKNCCEVFDGNMSLQNTKILKWNILKFEKSLVDTVDFIIVTPETYTFSDEIHNYLLKSKIQQDKIILFSDYFVQNDIDIYVDKVVTGHFGKNEIFVDGGCLDFSSSATILKHCSDMKKIYAFEPNVDQIESIRQNANRVGFSNVHIINGALWSENTRLKFEEQDCVSASHISTNENATKEVSAFTLDSVVAPTDRITFIKMDIEGAESEALEGAKMIITRDKPTLAISVYHKAQDYVDIPIYIKSLVPEYKMYLRHYTITNCETVLYCVY